MIQSLQWSVNLELACLRSQLLVNLFQDVGTDHRVQIWFHVVTDQVDVLQSWGAPLSYSQLPQLSQLSQLSVKTLNSPSISRGPKKLRTQFQWIDENWHKSLISLMKNGISWGMKSATLKATLSPGGTWSLSAFSTFKSRTMFSCPFSSYRRKGGAFLGRRSNEHGKSTRTKWQCSIVLWKITKG